MLTHRIHIYKPSLPLLRKIKVAVCNHQADSPFYLECDVCSGDLQIKKRIWLHNSHLNSQTKYCTYIQKLSPFKLIYLILVIWFKCVSGIASGRVLNGELYAQILQKLIYLHLLTGCFMKLSLQLIKANISGKCSNLVSKCRATATSKIGCQPGDCIWSP